MLLAPVGCQGVPPGGCGPPLPQGARGLRRAWPIRASFHLVVASLGEELKIWDKHTLTFWWDRQELSCEAFFPQADPEGDPAVAPGCASPWVHPRSCFIPWRVGQKGRHQRSCP